MERLKLIDDVRTRALSLMKEDATLTYDVASREAKISLVGADVLITKYHQPVELGDSILEIAKRELPPTIRVDLYQEDQLREMIAANRLGVDLDSFINIFLTPEQIRFITLVALSGGDINPYVMDLHFDPKEEMNKLKQQEVATMNAPEVPTPNTNYQKIYTPDFGEAA